MTSYRNIEIYSPTEFKLKTTELGSLLDLKNQFLNAILDNSGPIYWADLEYLFFDLIRNSKHSPKKIEAYNLGLQLLISEFEKYLTQQLEDFKFQEIPEMEQIFTDSGSSDIDSYILNFNYTSIFKSYSNLTTFSLNHIHGELGNNQNPPIIGYGDDYHDDFQNFKNLNNNRIFDYSKSTWYLRNSNYNQFLNWINEGKDFDVHIIGHSCGLTDRVLLKMIFEHKKCQRIWIHYYNDINGYLETAINISRHFDYPVKYRERLTNFEMNTKCPQLIK